VTSDHPLTEFATLSPLCPDGTYWYLLRRRLLRLIDEIAARPNIDADRVYLTGVSMGGMGVWSLGMAAPERFTALVPIAGGVYSPPMRRRFGRLADTPMWVIHDRHDPSIELERDAWAVARVREAGGSVRFTITEEGAHYVHEGFYRDSAFYDWLRTAAEVSPSVDM
jgi:predicted peptidase